MRVSDWLHKQGLEFDQRLRTAVERASCRYIDDAVIFIQLYKLNSTLTRSLPLNLDAFVAAERRIVHDAMDKHFDRQRVPLEDAQIGTIPLQEMFDRAASIVRRKRSHTIRVSDYLRAMIDVSEAQHHSFPLRPFTIDILMLASVGDLTAPLTHSQDLLKQLMALRDLPETEDDYQYVLSYQDDRIVFRVTSVLDDYVRLETQGVEIQGQAILTHFKDQFAGFTEDEVGELEALINHPRVRERDLQDYFERNPRFFRRWDYRQVHPQVVLGRTEGGILVPDFIVTDQETARAGIVELKLPRTKLIRHQDNRERFSAAVEEARAQLLTYRDWFRIPENRRRLCPFVGMEIVEPQLIVVIGRSTAFQSSVQRQHLASHMNDVQLMTYDDLLEYARRRRIAIAGVP